MAYGGGVGALAVSKVELSISCTKLQNLDVLSKSDPMCVVYVKHANQWVKTDATEMIKDNLNPKVYSVLFKHSNYYAYKRLPTVLS